MRIQVDHWKEVYRNLGKANPAARRQLQKTLKGDMTEVLAEAKAKASWSVKIPPAYALTVVAKGAGIRIKRKTAPIAVLNEFGVWRHPLFGNYDHWYPQPYAKPSVKPVVRAHRFELKVKAEKAARDALKEAGLK